MPGDRDHWDQGFVWLILGLDECSSRKTKYIKDGDIAQWQNICLKCMNEPGLNTKHYK